MIKGYISDFDGENITIVAPYSDAETLNKKQITECSIIIDDGRHISAQQRKFIYALIGYISDWTGYPPEYCKELVKCYFYVNSGCNDFSLSDVDMTTANAFLQYLIDFVIEHGISTDTRLAEMSPDIAKYVYKCLEKKVCCICGAKSDLHHVDRIGMGRDRTKINHIGLRAEPLCRIHHQEVDDIGQPAFDEKYFVCSVKIDEHIAKIYNLKGEKEN